MVKSLNLLYELEGIFLDANLHLLPDKLQKVFCAHLLNMCDAVILLAVAPLELLGNRPSLVVQARPF